MGCYQVGVHVFKVTWSVGCADSGVAELAADIYGPVDVDPTSELFLGAMRGSNQTWEFYGIAEALERI